MKRLIELIKQIWQKIEGQRWAVFMFLKNEIFKVQEGCVMPRMLLIIRFFLFPSVALLRFAEKFSPMKYDLMTDVYTIHGIKYSGAVFRHFGKHGFPVGSIVKFEKRENECVTLTLIKSGE